MGGRVCEAAGRASRGWNGKTVCQTQFLSNVTHQSHPLGQINDFGSKRSREIKVRKYVPVSGRPTRSLSTQ